VILYRYAVFSCERYLVLYVVMGLGAVLGDALPGHKLDSLNTGNSLSIKIRNKK